MAEVISLTDAKIDVFDNGAHTVCMKAGEPKEVPDSFLQALYGKGVVPNDEKTKEILARTEANVKQSTEQGTQELAATEVAPEEKAEAVELDPEKVQRIAEAMLKIELENDEEKMTSGGQVRASAIETEIGEDTSKEERHAAINLMVG